MDIALGHIGNEQANIFPAGDRGAEALAEPLHTGDRHLTPNTHPERQSRSPSTTAPCWSCRFRVAVSSGIAMTCKALAFRARVIRTRS
ncbi:hypothetical protein [Kitasatospora nipponensis]|uniref:hypothetical protein n=1 Tax=Kitasatospora nipponensis TaxID=258049 RepID=UPI0031D8C9D8